MTLIFGRTPKSGWLKAIALAATLVGVMGASAATAAVDMQVSSFTDTPDPAVAGGLLDFDFIVENSGNSPAAGATLSVPLPAGVDFISVTPAANCSYTAAPTHEVNCSFGTLQGTLAGGSPVPVKITVRPTSDGVVNTTATAGPTDGNPGNNVLTQNTTVDPGADLTIQSMAFTPNPAVAGGFVTLSTIVQNLGPNSAAGATITFNLPPGLIYQSGSHGGAGWSCSGTTTVTCSTSASISASGTASTLTWQAKVNHGQVGTIQTQASVTSVTRDGNGSNNSATADLSVTAGTDLEVLKFVSSDPVLANQAMSFTIQVNNLGPFPASTVQVTDTIAANFTGISASGTGWTCGVVGQDVTCDRATLAVGSAPVITVNATAPDNPQIVPATGMTVVNTASVTTATQDPVAGNNSGQVSFSLLRTSADLQMNFTRSNLPVAVGQTLTSTIRVRNLGPLAIAGSSAFQASYLASANETYQSFSGSGWSYLGLVGGRHLFEHAGPLAANANASNLVITTQANAAGSISSQACTGSTNVTPPAETDINAANDCVTRGNTGSALSADISLTKAVSPGTLISADGTITYTLVITNNSATVDALDVRLSDPIPMYSGSYTAGGETRPATTVAGTWINDGATNGNCTGTSTQSCNVGTIAAGRQAVVTITVTRPMSSGTWVNNANAYSYGTGDSNLNNNLASATVTIEPSLDIAVTQKTVTPNPVKAGVEAVYTIQVRNLGPSTANAVTLTDTFTTVPGDFTFISASASGGGSCGSYNAGAQSVACNWTSIASQGVQTMTVRIRPNYLSGGQHSIANTAVAATSSHESDLTNNSRSATLNVDPGEIDLLITETDLADPVGFDPSAPATNLIVYQVDVTNRGPSYATGVQFTDTWTQSGAKTITLLCDRPTATAGAATTCAGAPAPVCGAVGNVATCALGDMAANTSRSHYLIYRVDTAPAATGDTFQKTAVVSANEPESLSANNTELETTTVRALADVEVVSKTATPASVSINEPFNWTIVVRNNGPGAAVNTQLADALPSGMRLTATPTTTVGSCTGAVGATSLACSFGDLNSGATATITVPVRMTSYPSGGTVSNSASVTTDSIDTVPGNNSNSGPVTVTRASIAGSVYIDANDDGTRQGGETGIGSVSLRLTGTDLFGNPVDVTRTTNGSTGNFSFSDLAPSNAAGYTITETHPTAYIDGQDNASGPVLPNSKTSDVITGIVLPAATDLSGYTFGELQFASIAGRVWYDPSNDGIIQGGEAVRIGSVRIDLTGTDDLNQAVNLNTNTNGSGQYSFPNLRPGTYTLTETAPPSPYLPGLAAAGTGVTGAAGTPDNAPASAAFGNVIAGIGLQGGNAGVEYNFGELLPGSLAGNVYYDTDDSGGAIGANEPGIAGVNVTLTGTDYRGNAIAPVTIATGTDGSYSFPNLLPGTYAITEAQPSGWTDGQETLGSIGGTAGADVFTAVVLNSGVAGTGYNFGERSAGIAGSVYDDANDDGIRQVSETGIPSVVINLTGCVNRTATTDANGRYQFAGLPACPTGYTLSEVQPAAYSDGRDTEGTAGGTVTNDVIADIILGTTTYATGYDFGEHGRVATNVSCTTSSPTAKNIREPFNWTFTVGNSGPGAAPATVLANTLPAGLEMTAAATSTIGTCTGASGATSYSCNIGYLTNGASATVTVPVRAVSYPAGGTLTNSAGVTTEGNDTTPGDNNCQAPVTIQQATLAGTVFVDPNNNGTQDNGEAGIPGATIRLTGTDLYGNAVDVTTQTATPAGTYQFTALAPADATGYTVTETQPTGFADGMDIVGSAGGNIGGALPNDVIGGIALAANVNATGYNFAEISQGLSGTVYVDSNNNGQQDSGEPGIPNVTLRITGTDVDSNPVDTTATTDANGYYLFGGLRPSNATGYVLVETQPGAWADGLDRVGSAGGTLGNDRIEAIVLPAGQISTNYDFGERGAQVCGYVYSDLNNNGQREASEVGIPAASLTLTGIDVDGRPISRVVQTQSLATPAGDLGRYCFSDLPLSNGTGYTINETQPPDTADGIDTAGTLGGTAGNDVISGIVFPQAGGSGDNYNFGETITNAAALSGFVWFDADHDRNREPTGRGGWTVELIRGDIGGAYTVVATTVSAADGSYRFDGLPPGSGYTVIFRNPDGNYVYGYLPNLTLTANTELTEQNQPIDPSGVVYDQLTRVPVAGAVVTISGPAGFDPALHLVGGPANVAQTTGATGEYKFLLLPGAPAGSYDLAVTVPTGYVQRVSTAIPACTAALSVGAVPNPALVQTSDFAPVAATALHDPNSCPATSAGLAAGAATTQYYLSVVLSATSANLINNHIPIERLATTNSLVVTKTTPRVDVTRGELVPYTITIRNNQIVRQTDIALVDQIPPGFQYRSGSARIDNVAREPVSAGRQLTWDNLTIESNATVTVRLMLVVGSGVSPGEFVNQAWAVNSFTNTVASNVAKATVRVVPDPTFDCSDIIGKVFDDRNRDGYQNKGEPGIANVRIATVRGLLVTTDKHGRFHVACADIPDEDRGANFIMKLDTRTLPSGYRVTTENPRVVRLTRGKMTKLNFGAAIHRVVRIDLMDNAFAPGSTSLKPVWSQHLAKVFPVLAREESVLRIAYGRSGEDPRLASDRVRALTDYFRSNWKRAGGGYHLSIETEVYRRSATK